MLPVYEDQGATYRCGPYCAGMWAAGYGYSWQEVTATAAWRSAVATADSQRGYSFGQERQLLLDLAAQLGDQVSWLGDGYLRDFATFDQAVRDTWAVIVGVWLGDLANHAQYQHFICVDGLDGDSFTLIDSFKRFDGETGTESVESLHTAIHDNWDPSVIGLAFKLHGKGGD